MVVVSEPQQIAEQFAGPGAVLRVESFGAGNVNDTYLVTLAAPLAAANGAHHFVLQRINQHVFRQPELILVNMRTFTDFMQRQLAQVSNDGGRRWEVPQVIQTQRGADFVRDAEGGFWRAITLVAGATTYPRIRDAAHAREAGYALGRFHALISDLDPNRLHDTLPGFHITPRYLAHYDQVAADDSQPLVGNPAAIEYGRRFVDARRDWAAVLETAQAEGKLRLRAMHGDPKVDNILIDDATAQAVSIVDLDTVKPGLVHYDIGDCLRSCCNPAGEEATDLAGVVFDLALCRNILAGYLGEAASFFTAHDYDYLYDAIRLITFELGLRFFTDHLAGNPYFKVKHPEHNLQRALVQFRLVEQIEIQEAAIRKIVASFAPV
jgi:Ser/Thr protein kinase RdoA (MazF antagonist)